MILGTPWQIAEILRPAMENTSTISVTEMVGVMLVGIIFTTGTLLLHEVGRILEEKL